jgi:ribonucleoside-diphosphate reductase alpha chain
MTDEVLYNPQGFAWDIFQKRYALHDKETFAEACERVAGHVAMAEAGDKVVDTKQAFKELLQANLFMPGGRIWYGSGRPKGQLLNCFVTPTHDSREGWGRLVSDVIVIAGTGGGNGTNFSPIRPRGSKINGSGGFATGAVSLMEVVNAAGEVIKAGGGRRTALMFTLSLTHGDIEEFLDKKLDLNKLNNANVSVWFDEDPNDFFELVRKDEELELKHGGKVVGKIPAKRIWKKIVSNALRSGEPGMLNGYLANKMSNIGYYKPLISTNPCFAPGTLIQTRTGDYPIEELVGKTVEVWDGMAWRICDNFRVTGENQDILKIKLQDGSLIRVTPYHKMVLETGVRIDAKDIITGQRLLISEIQDRNLHSPNFNEVVSITADGIEPKVYCCTINSTHLIGLSCGIITGQCGEIFLTAYDCCCLGALVLPRFVKNGEIDNEMLKQATKTAVRFLDDVLSVNNYPLPEIKETCTNIRRIGLGVMGLHDMLLLQGLKYSSAAALEQVDRVMNMIKNAAYEASIDLAAEKGAFIKFDADKFLRSGFAKTLKASIRADIKEKGIRNCAILTIAPTGTTSLVCDVTSGIEPMFSPAHIRKFRDGEKLKSEVVIHPLLKQFMEAGKSVKHFQGAMDIKIRDHFEMQRVCQRHIDNAVSKTINLPKGVSEDELSDLYMEFFPDLKGVTIYPDGSREDQPLTPMSLDDAIKHVKSAKVEATAKDSCKDGYCEI